jgi:hypothetical protein
MRDGLVCRDIAGVYFILDIYDKHFYRDKQVNCVNQIAYTMISLMIEKKTFTEDDILDEMLKIIAPSEGVTPERVKSDIVSLIGQLQSKGWLNYA